MTIPLRIQPVRSVARVCRSATTLLFMITSPSVATLPWSVPRIMYSKRQVAAGTVTATP
jgi:hypothetical protein